MTEPPGALRLANRPIRVNQGRRTATLAVRNSSRWPIQVSSHYHFFEVNRRLVFDRARAFGMRLDVPAGAGVRWAPGETKEVRLVEFGGRRELWGFAGLTNGPATPARLPEALRRAAEQGFLATTDLPEHATD
jgi:urease beta subunit